MKTHGEAYQEGRWVETHQRVGKGVGLWELKGSKRVGKRGKLGIQQDSYDSTRWSSLARAMALPRLST
jgi:hypothetical protein